MIDWHKLRDTSGVSLLLGICADLGIPPHVSLASTKITAEDLESPLASVSIWQELVLIRNIQAFRRSEEGLGLMVSERFSAASMGVFGQALASSQNLKEVWELMAHYKILGLSFSRFEFASQGDQLSLTLHDAEVPLDCQRFCEERGLGACLALFNDILQQPVKPKSVQMRLPAPSTPEAYHTFFGTQVEFNAASTQIVFDRHIETLALPNANRKLHLASIRYCNEVIDSHAAPMTTEDRVRTLLKDEDLSIDLEAVAQHLGVSSRQLRRQLSKEGISFREILLKLKFDRAQALLTSGMPVNQVALELGYTSPASFSRAFKKFSGKSPSQAMK